MLEGHEYYWGGRGVLYNREGVWNEMNEAQEEGENCNF